MKKCSVDGSGNLDVAGNMTVGGAVTVTPNTSATAGAIVEYLEIMIAGTTYKVPLYS